MSMPEQVNGTPAPAYSLMPMGCRWTPLLTAGNDMLDTLVVSAPGYRPQLAEHGSSMGLRPIHDEAAEALQADPRFTAFAVAEQRAAGARKELAELEESERTDLAALAAEEESARAAGNLSAGALGKRLADLDARRQAIAARTQPARVGMGVYEAQAESLRPAAERAFKWAVKTIRDRRQAEFAQKRDGALRDLEEAVSAPLVRYHLCAFAVNGLYFGSKFADEEGLLDVLAAELVPHAPTPSAAVAVAEPVAVG